ncbi:MAG: glycine oxidase ThiO [Myxococcota bacterium]|nr:glycine oxidase ThiO [Myxococcota bacterium]
MNRHPGMRRTGSGVSDVIVVGGGVIGCAVTWGLAREGLSVTLLERDDLATRASGAMAGMLLGIGEDARTEFFRAWARRSLASFPELCADLRERSGIDPEFEACGALYVAETPESAAVLQRKAEGFAAEGAEWLDAEGLRLAEPQLAPTLHGALWGPREAHVRSPLLARAYAAAAESLGAEVLCGVTVTGLRETKSRVHGVDTDRGPRDAGHVVLCAGAWSPRLAGLRLPVEPVRGQTVSVENLRPALRTIVFGDALYLVPKRDASVVVGATVERVGFDAGVTARGVASLLHGAERLAPELAGSRFHAAWAGLRPVTPDGLPCVGPVPGREGLWLAAGHTRNGVLLAPVTADLVAELVLGKSPALDVGAVSPGRVFPESGNGGAQEVSGQHEPE